MMERELHCVHLTTAAKAVRGTNPLHNTHESISEAIEVSDCCRESGLFDIASELLAIARSFPVAKEKDLKSRIDQQRKLIAKQDASPLPENKTNGLPPLWIRGWNFATAMARHAANGLKMCSKKKIDARLAICQKCPKLKDDHCSLCGCACNESNRLLNKLALESEKCPLKKW